AGDVVEADDVDHVVAGAVLDDLPAGLDLEVLGLQGDGGGELEPLARSNRRDEECRGNGEANHTEQPVLLHPPLGKAIPTGDPWRIAATLDDSTISDGGATVRQPRWHRPCARREERDGRADALTRAAGRGGRPLRSRLRAAPVVPGQRPSG